jgi:hypothetical protein
MKLVWFINEVVSSRSVNVEVVASLVSGREGKGGARVKEKDN